MEMQLEPFAFSTGTLPVESWGRSHTSGYTPETVMEKDACVEDQENGDTVMEQVKEPAATSPYRYTKVMNATPLMSGELPKSPIALRSSLHLIVYEIFQLVRTLLCSEIIPCRLISPMSARLLSLSYLLRRWTGVPDVGNEQSNPGFRWWGCFDTVD